ncbi:LrgB family protein [Paraburkholderia sp. BL21I4N1]|uniref:LrgB family protein n=1 Tax=Paraburkholderia sp. BL21I4N1 TaxID=1938801 RepID=UPI000CFC2278|nr:LrgB family protein [Paraburkholderia sp. BL21I4N1]PQV44816.1 putative effector of murein hydrolase [Paraburkholderia sp. BL21I4N1]
MTTATISLGLIALTLAAYSAGNWLYLRSGNLPILQPVLIATSVLVAALLGTGLPYDRYFDATAPLHDLLGPAVVALAVPLYENVHKARAVLWRIALATLLGGAAVTGSALLLGRGFGLSPLMERALSTKSLTTPIALSVASKIGGSVPLTILGVFVTGLVGVTLTPLLLETLRIDNPAVKGFTLGLTSHTFGITRALEFGSEAVAFATLGMALMGCTSAVLVPVIFRLL